MASPDDALEQGASPKTKASRRHPFAARVARLIDEDCTTLGRLKLSLVVPPGAAPTIRLLADPNRGISAHELLEHRMKATAVETELNEALHALPPGAVDSHRLSRFEMSLCQYRYGGASGRFSMDVWGTSLYAPAARAPAFLGNFLKVLAKGPFPEIEALALAARTPQPSSDPEWRVTWKYARDGQIRSARLHAPNRSQAVGRAVGAAPLVGAVDARLGKVVVVSVDRLLQDNATAAIAEWAAVSPLAAFVVGPGGR